MSSLPGPSTPSSSIPGIPAAPPLKRVNPDRNRRDQDHSRNKGEGDHDPEPRKRGTDTAELSHHDEAAASVARTSNSDVAHGPRPMSDDHPHLDVQA